MLRQACPLSWESRPESPLPPKVILRSVGTSVTTLGGVGISRRFRTPEQAQPSCDTHSTLPIRLRSHLSERDGSYRLPISAAANAQAEGNFSRRPSDPIDTFGSRQKIYLLPLNELGRHPPSPIGSNRRLAQPLQYSHIGDRFSLATAHRRLGRRASKSPVVFLWFSQNALDESRFFECL